MLIVEDDAGLRSSLSRSLADHGHVVRSVGLGGDAFAELRRPTDVVVLDLNLPDADGHEVLARIRTTSDIPVIIATGRDEEHEIVSLLDAGADDYIVKPYSIGQLEARIRAVLRRAAATTPDRRLCVGELTIDLTTRRTALAGTAIELSRREFDLLAALAARPDEVVTKRELLADVWRQPHGGADKTVDVHLSWLRRKLGETADQPRYLHTVRGVGVKIVDPT